MLTKTKTEKQEQLIAFPSLFAKQLAKTPDNLAIVYEDKEYSYSELDALSNTFKNAITLSTNNTNSESDELCNELRNELGDELSNDLSNEWCIGICIDKSPEAIAAMLGILKAGAAFVPLDPEYPAERIAYMIQDANINTIIIQPKYQKKLEPLIKKKIDNTHSTIHWVDCYQPISENSQHIKQEAKQKIKPSDLAYVMYTSGSTGKPKGVQIEHEALATYCYADIDVYKVAENDRTLQFSTINFDIAIEEIFPPLLTGSCIVIRPSKHTDSLIELSSIINNYQVTAVHIATAYWHEWVDLMVAAKSTIPESLRLMVVTGEKVSTKHYQHWKTLCQQSGKTKNKKVLWCNAYGPTEATVSASAFIPDESFDADNMPIGKPLKRYTAIIVDEHYNDLPSGKTGQLLIGGPALARGYLNRPDLNKDVFVTVNHNGKKQRMYKTGDLARWMPNGDIEFAGRIDHQIKLGSYRIEPGEIEAAINKHELVLESLVSYDEINGKKALIAYIAQGKNTIIIDALSEFLKNSLPAYMVPTRFILLPDFPKTTNGKIDRKALPDPTTSQIANTSNYIAPRNQLEQKLADIWEDVLRIPKVGIHDDFFGLGGSSLLAVGIVSRLITELKLELPVRDFFANPTIASQAKHIHQMLQSENIKSDLHYENITDEDDSQALRDRLPIIKPAFFGSTNAASNNHKLFGIHYQPPLISTSIKTGINTSTNTNTKKHAVLMCHPLGHEYSRSYRNLQQLAILLAQAGFDVFRFDYLGTGNSQGNSEQTTAKQCVEDIQTAANYIQKQSQCEELSIIGIRIGAPLALQAQHKINNIKNLIAWDPVVQGNDYLQLLEKFHHKALTGIRRYRSVRKNVKDNQLFGYAYSKEKYTSLKNVTLDTGYQEDNIKHKHIITSSNYLNKEKNLQQTSNWKYHSTSDDIYWHNADYTESAFSSPEIFNTILQILKSEAG